MKKIHFLANYHATYLAVCRYLLYMRQVLPLPTALPARIAADTVVPKIAPTNNSEVQVVLTASVIAEQPSRFRSILAAGAGILCMTGAASAAQAAEPTDTVQMFPVNIDVTTGVLGHTWLHWGALAAVVGGAYFLNGVFNRIITSFDKDAYTSRKSSIIANGARWGRRLMWGAAALMGLEIFGVELGNLAVTSGVVVAVVAFNSKDAIRNTGAYLGIKWRGELKDGDCITVGGVSGVVQRVTPFAVVIEGVDKQGTRRQYYIPPTKILTSVWQKATYDDELLSTIRVGEWIHITDRISGQVACETEHTIGVRVENAAGALEVHHIQRHEITELSLDYHGTAPPPLPEGVKKGDQIQLAGVTGAVVDYNAQYVRLETEDVITRIPRTKFQEPWAVVEN